MWAPVWSGVSPQSVPGRPRAAVDNGGDAATAGASVSVTEEPAPRCSAAVPDRSRQGRADHHTAAHGAARQDGPLLIV